MSAIRVPAEHRMACALLLQWLASEGRARRESGQSTDVVATQSAMAFPYQLISDTALAQALNINRQDTDIHGWVYGPETGKPGSSSTPEVIPAITVSWS